MKINTIEDFNEAIVKYPGIPTEVLLDATNRIGDWMASGGSIEDDYIKQQFRYTENTIKFYWKKEIEYESQFYNRWRSKRKRKTQV